MAAAPFFFATPRRDSVQITTATGTGWSTLVAGGASGTKVVSIGAVSESTAAQVVQLSLLRDATNYVLGSVSVAASAGNDGTVAAANLLSSTLLPFLATDNDGQKYLFLSSTADALQVKTTVAVPTGRTIHIGADGGNG
jgi:hypothetical protein